MYYLQEYLDDLFSFHKIQSNIICCLIPIVDGVFSRQKIILDKVSWDPAAEGLHCKRPIQCLASPEILTPHPLTARRVCTPCLWCGGRTPALGGEGDGGSIFLNTALYSIYVRTLWIRQTYGFGLEKRR